MGTIVGNVIDALTAVSIRADEAYPGRRIPALTGPVAAVRLAAGCETPFDILPAVWVTSLLSVTVGITAAKIFSKIWRD